VLTAGDYADALRALGRFLDSVHASKVRIADRVTHLEVSWLSPGGREPTMLFQTDDVDALRSYGSLLRGALGSTPRLSLQEELRTLGRELDDVRVEQVLIEPSEEGFLVTGRSSGAEYRQIVSHDDLRAAAEAFHRRRFTEDTDPGEPAEGREHAGT
jgi:hypothetical protein